MSNLPDETVTPCSEAELIAGVVLGLFLEDSRWLPRERVRHDPVRFYRGARIGAHRADLGNDDE